MMKMLVRLEGASQRVEEQPIDRPGGKGRTPTAEELLSMPLPAVTIPYGQLASEVLW